MALFDGCPKLRRLHIEMCWECTGKLSHTVKLALLALRLWERAKPALEIVESMPAEDDLDYNVMEA